MNLNKVLAVIIVLIFLLAFCVWVLISSVALFSDPVKSIPILISGTIGFGFWFLVSYRLYYSRYEKI